MVLFSSEFKIKLLTKTKNILFLDKVFYCNFILFLSINILISCGSKDTISYKVINNDPTTTGITKTSVEQPSEQSNPPTNNTNSTPEFSLSNLSIYLDNFLSNETSPTIRVEGLVSGSSLKLRSSSCQGEILSSLDHDGNFEELENYNEYTDILFYLELSYLGQTECRPLEKHWIYLERPTLSLNEVQTNLDKRSPKFNVANLFNGKEVEVLLYENESCNGEPVSQLVRTSSGNTTIGLSSNISDLATHSYYVKQSYSGLSSCSSAQEYSYTLSLENLSLAYDDLIFEGEDSPISVAKMIEGSQVSLHKGGCNFEADDTITQDGNLRPSVSNSYTDTSLYLKYSYEETSSCSEIGSRYIKLEQPTLNLNSAQTALHKRTPTFNITNLFVGKNVTVSLHDNSTCSGESVAGSIQTDTGSSSLTLSSEIMDNNTHTYYAKQTYLGHSSCSVGIEYTYGLNISDLTITSDSILYGTLPSSISVSGMIEGSTVSIHKGSCGASADDSISEDGNLTPLPVNIYIESNIYLKYSLNGASSCDSIGVTYLNLATPNLSLNEAQTNLDKRVPKFNATNLFTGKQVSVTLHESLDCSGDSVSSTINSDTGSALISLSSNLTDISSHSYSLKQSYSGYSSCSNTLSYQYEIDTSNLGISADELLYGTTPGSISISKMISGSTVSLHKGSCGALADDSINSDGTLTPTSSGSYNYSGLYIKYTKGGSSDCDPIDSYYLYLEQASLSLNSAQTDLHPLTPTFNISNLYSGKSVTAQLYEDSSCLSSSVSTSSQTSSGSTTLTLSSPLSDSDTHTYYVKQSYLGFSSCSSGFEYTFSADTSDLSLTYNPVLYGPSPSGITVSGMVTGSTLSLYKGDNCNGVADSTINVDGTIYPVATNSYTETDIYIKYSFDESSSCTKLDTSYIYLESPAITLATPLSDARIPVYNVTGLFTGKSVTTTLHESSNCSGEPVSSNVVSDTGSATVTKSVTLTDLNSHSFSVKQSYKGASSCSNFLNYQYSIDTSNLEISADPILYGSTPGSVTISKMISGSTVSLHKGSCEALADDSINSDGTLSPSVPSEYSEETLYIKYTKGGSSDCDAISSKYLYLKTPVISLNSASTAIDPRYPVFNVSDLYSGKTKTITLYNGSGCSGDVVRSSSSTSLGSTTISPSSPLTTTNSYNYSVRQTYEGYSTCSNALAYQYEIDTSNLAIAADEILFGSTPGSVSISHMISGSTVSLHKGSCGAAADASINADGSLTPTSSGSYNYSQLYIKYTKGGSSDCDPIDSYYLYLEKALISLNSSQTELHPLTPTFNITNLYSGKLVTAQLYEDSSCLSSSVSTSSQTSSGSTTLTLSSNIQNTNTHTYYVKQSYMGTSSCSLGVNYQFSLSVSELTLTYDTIIDGSSPTDISVSGMSSGTTVSLHRGSCNADPDDSINEDGTLTPQVGSSYAEDTLYIKYGYSGVTDCQAISSTYMYLEAPVASINSSLTNTNPSQPSIDVSNLFSGKNVEIAVYKNSTCSGTPISRSLNSNTGSATISLLTAHGSYSYWIKQSYQGFTSCSNQVNYTYTRHPEFQEFLHDRNDYKGYYPLNQNRGIVVKNTTPGNKIKLYTGTNCTDPSHLLTTVTSYSNTTDIETPTIEDGPIRFSFLELDSSDNEIGCFTSPSLTMRTKKFIGSYNEFYIELDNTKRNIEITYITKTTHSFSKNVKNMYMNSHLGVAILFEDGSIKTVGKTECGGDSSYVENELDGTIPVISVYSSFCSFAALRSNGSVITWGDAYYGGDSSSVTSLIDGTIDVTSIYSNGYAFAALRSDGSLITWGNNSFGGDISYFYEDEYYVKYVDGTIPVVNIYPIFCAFVALISNGAIITWGDYGASNGWGISYLNDESQVDGTIPVKAIYSNEYSVAALRSDGSVVTWGVSSYGGDSSEVETELDGTIPVSSIYPNRQAFAALRTDGSVVTWGDSTYGGDSSEVEDELNGAIPVISIYSDAGSFAALRDDGSVITWGDSEYCGGDSSEVASEINGTIPVAYIYSTEVSFLAVRSNGSIITWGDSLYGGDSSEVASLIDGSIPIISIHSNDASAIAVLRSDGSVVTWGTSSFGGDSSSVASLIDGTIPVVNITVYDVGFFVERSDGTHIKWYMSTPIPDNLNITSIHSSQIRTVFLLSDGSVINWGDLWDDISVSSKIDGTIPVSSIYSNGHAFAALRADGSVITWGGDSNTGGDSSSVASELDGTIPVSSIYPNSQAFAALRSDGSVVTWGYPYNGGDSSSVASEIDGTIDVTNIYSNGDAYAALRTDGSVVTWGTSTYGGNSSSVASEIDGTIPVTSIFSTERAFAALKSDGSVVTWGNSTYGGNSSSVSSEINGTIPVTAIYSSSNSNGGAFAALRSDGSVVTWGNSTYGGNSSSVASQIDGTIDVTDIYTNGYAYAALRTDGSVVTWGSSSSGGNSSSVASQINGTIRVTSIYTGAGTFAALRSDGSVVTWGLTNYGGDSSSVASQIDGTIPVTSIISTSKAFIAIRSNGSVVSWGDGGYGGDCSSVASEINGTIPVTSIYFTNNYAFAALRSDGSVVTWGRGAGSDSSYVSGKLDGTIDVTTIYPLNDGFIAKRQDGSFVYWGEFKTDF